MPAVGARETEPEAAAEAEGGRAAEDEEEEEPAAEEPATGLPVNEYPPALPANADCGLDPAAAADPASFDAAALAAVGPRDEGGGEARAPDTALRAGEPCRDDEADEAALLAPLTLAPLRLPVSLLPLPSLLK